MTEPADKPKRRFRVVFTSVGWQVIDTQVSRDPVAEFGLGQVEYERAKKAAKEAEDEQR